MEDGLADADELRSLLALELVPTPLFFVQAAVRAL